MQQRLSDALPLCQVLLNRHDERDFPHLRPMSEDAKRDIAFGTRFAAARKAVTPKLTQEALAEKLGVSKAQISRYESGLDKPGREKVPALEEAIGVSFEFLMTGSHSARGVVIDQDTYEMLMRVNDLPPALQAFVSGALRLAEQTKDLVPDQFLNAPTPENWQEFQAYLSRISALLPKKGDPDPPKE